VNSSEQLKDPLLCLHRRSIWPEAGAMPDSASGSGGFDLADAVCERRAATHAAVTSRAEQVQVCSALGRPGIGWIGPSKLDGSGPYPPHGLGLQIWMARFSAFVGFHRHLPLAYCLPHFFSVTTHK